MSVLEIIAVLISVLGVTLTIKRHIACWVVNFIACLLYAYLFFEYQLYGETVLQTLFMGMAVYGFSSGKLHSSKNNISSFKACHSLKCGCKLH